MSECDERMVPLLVATSVAGDQKTTIYKHFHWLIEISKSLREKEKMREVTGSARKLCFSHGKNSRILAFSRNIWPYFCDTSAKTCEKKIVRGFCPIRNGPQISIRVMTHSSPSYSMFYGGWWLGLFTTVGGLHPIAV